MFRREVAAFRDSVMYPIEADVDAQFREFLRLVDMFVKSDSSYEVNISCRARTEVTRYCKEASFKELDAGDKADIFTPAETQTSNMLADNLLAKFQANGDVSAHQRRSLGHSVDQRDSGGTVLMHKRTH